MNYLVVDVVKACLWRSDLLRQKVVKSSWLTSIAVRLGIQDNLLSIVLLLLNNIEHLLASRIAEMLLDDPPIISFAFLCWEQECSPATFLLPNNSQLAGKLASVDFRRWITDAILFAYMRQRAIFGQGKPILQVLKHT